MYFVLLDLEIAVTGYHVDWYSTNDAIKFMSVFISNYLDMVSLA